MILSISFGSIVAIGRQILIFLIIMASNCDMYFAMNSYRSEKVIYFLGDCLLIFYIGLKTSIKWIKIHFLLSGAFILAYSGFVLATVDEDLNEAVRLL